MKGVTLISDVFLLVALIAVTVIMSLFIWALIYIFQVESKLTPGGMPTTRNVELKLFLKPVTYNALMSAFLEYPYQGIPMKKILTAVAVQGSTDIWLDGKFIDAKAVSQSFLTPQIDKYYLLKIGDIEVASNGLLTPSTVPTGLQKVSTNLFLLNGEKTYLQFFVVD
jgi:hypothetical protein